MKDTITDKILQAFPKYLEKDVLIVCQLISRKNWYKRFLVHNNCYQVVVAKENLNIFSRVYFKEVNDINLTPLQKKILYCIYTRHHNGFIREKYLTKMGNITYIWEVPFVVQLLGEYVEELFPIINNKINQQSIEFFQQFINENPFYFYQTECRVASYWNEYYRRKYPKLRNYIGYQVKEKIKHATKNNHNSRKNP